MKTFKVTEISGEYATLTDNDGEQLFIAIALLPFGIDIGTLLQYENLEFSIIN